MPTEHEHHVAGPLTIAALLAAGAGFVDAAIYRNVTPVFVANMSGNLIRFGMAVGDPSAQVLASAAIALACFAGGVALAASLIDRSVASRRPPASTGLLAIETIALAAAVAIAFVSHVEPSPRLTVAAASIVALASAGMGIQAIALRRVGAVAVSTTYGTGAIVRVGEKVALASRHAPNPHGVRRRRSILVLASVLAAYAAGAALASVIPERHVLLGIIPVVLVGLTAALRRRTARAALDVPGGNQNA